MVYDSELNVVVTDVVIALQDEDLKYQNLVIAGPSILEWVHLHILEDSEGLPEILEIDVGVA